MATLAPQPRQLGQIGLGQAQPLRPDPGVAGDFDAKFPVDPITGAAQGFVGVGVEGQCQDEGVVIEEQMLAIGGMKQGAAVFIEGDLHFPQGAGSILRAELRMAGLPEADEVDAG